MKNNVYDAVDFEIYRIDKQIKELQQRREVLCRVLEQEKYQVRQ